MDSSLKTPVLIRSRCAYQERTLIQNVLLSKLMMTFVLLVNLDITCLLIPRDVSSSQDRSKTAPSIKTRTVSSALMLLLQFTYPKANVSSFQLLTSLRTVPIILTRLPVNNAVPPSSYPITLVLSMMLPTVLFRLRLVLVTNVLMDMSSRILPSLLVRL